MKLFFIDETGNFAQKQNVIHGGVIFNIASYFVLSEQIKEIKFKYFGNKTKELKWSDLTIANYLLKINKPLSREIQWLNEFGSKRIEGYLHEAIKCASVNAESIISTISRATSFPYEVDMLQFHISDLMERFQFYLQETNDYGLMIFDSINPTKDKFLKKSYQFLLENHNYIEKYSRIVDSLLSELSQYSAGIQAADYVVGAIGGSCRNYVFSKMLFKESILPKLRSTNGTIIGRGIKISPSSDQTLKEMIVGLLL